MRLRRTPLPALWTLLCSRPRLTALLQGISLWWRSYFIVIINVNTHRRKPAGGLCVYTDMLHLRRATRARQRSRHHGSRSSRRSKLTLARSRIREQDSHRRRQRFIQEASKSFLTRYKGGEKRKSFELLIRRTTLGANFRLWRSPPQACGAFKITEGQLFHYRE